MSKNRASLIMAKKNAAAEQKKAKAKGARMTSISQVIAAARGEVEEVCVLAHFFFAIDYFSMH